MRNWIQILMVFCLLPLVALAAGCNTAPAEEPTEPAASVFPIELIDQAGNTVSISRMPEKIVSLAPSNTEIVYALGLQDKLVAVTEHCDYPEEAKSKPKIGGFSSVDIEKVVALQPDLVLATSRHEEDITPELVRLGFTTLTLNPKNLDEVMAAISLTGRAAGAEDRADQLVAEMKARIKAVTDRTDTLAESQRPRVFYLLWHDPLMTAGPKVIISELITMAGGINIAAGLDGDYPKMSLEAMIIADPEVIIADSGHGDGEILSFTFAQSESRLETIAARQNDRVYKIDSDIVTIAGPRIVAGLEEMARLIHPEIFGQG
ncbi:MAG: cobalamin-binding protein [Dehalococcoidales bacterium]|jgi:iron complex transport system substrate-binding protein